jgi:hypothetical protein
MEGLLASCTAPQVMIPTHFRLSEVRRIADTGEKGLGMTESLEEEQTSRPEVIVNL